MNKSKLLLLSLCFLFSDAVFALRCGHELVDIGDYKEDIIEKCGEPESIETHIEIRGATDRFGARTRVSPDTSINLGQQHWTEIEVVIEEWIYNFGRRRLQKYLRFENGRLKEIKDLGRGHYH